MKGDLNMRMDKRAIATTGVATLLGFCMAYYGLIHMGQTKHRVEKIPLNAEAAMNIRAARGRGAPILCPECKAEGKRSEVQATGGVWFDYESYPYASTSGRLVTDDRDVFRIEFECSNGHRWYELWQANKMIEAGDLEGGAAKIIQK